MTEKRYTLAEAQRIMEQNRCADATHRPYTELFKPGLPTGTWFCECGKYTWTAQAVTTSR